MAKRADPKKAEKQRLAQAVRDFGRAERKRDQAIRRAAGKGLSSREIASVVGLSHTRILQIVRARN